MKLAKNQANAKQHPVAKQHPELNFCYYLHSSFTLSSKNDRAYSIKKRKSMSVFMRLYD